MMYGWACSTLSGRSDHTRGWDSVGFAFESSLSCGYDGMYMGGKRKERQRSGQEGGGRGEDGEDVREWRGESSDCNLSLYK